MGAIYNYSQECQDYDNGANEGLDDLDVTPDEPNARLPQRDS